MAAKIDQHYSVEREARTGNSGYKKLAVQWLIEHFCFVSYVLLADSFMLLNRQLLKPENRLRQTIGGSANF